MEKPQSSSIKSGFSPYQTIILRDPSEYNGTLNLLIDLNYLNDKYHFIKINLKKVRFLLIIIVLITKTTLKN